MHDRHFRRRKGTDMSDEAGGGQTQDKTLEDTFPASDPPANSGITGAETPDKPSNERNTEEIPTGRPTSDRHATETAHQWENEEKS
jgi:hypothetical protein